MIENLQIDTLINSNVGIVVDSLSTTTDYFCGIPISVIKVILPLATPILLFFLGFFINWLKKKYERRSMLSSVKLMIISWSEHLKTPVKQQIIACRKFVSALRESDYITTQMMSFNSLLADKLNEISIINYSETFIINLKGNEQKNSKQLYNLISSFDYFSKYGLELRKLYDKFEIETLEIMNQWNVLIRKLDELKFSYAEEIAYTENHPSESFFHEYAKIGENFKRNFPNGDATNKQLQETVINPLYEKTKIFLDNNNKDKLAMEVLDLVIDLNVVLRKWNIHKNGYCYVFMEYAIHGVKSYRTIYKAINHFKPLKMKSVFKIN